VQWVLGTYVLWVKQLEYEAGHFCAVLRLRNAWSLYSALPYAYMVWYFTEHREIIPLPLLMFSVEYLKLILHDRAT